jgi:MYXO-CTERM domain-containing protein
MEETLVKRKLGGILAVLFLTLTLGFAQGAGSGGSDATSVARDNNQASNQTYSARGDNGGGHNWGWVGLLGLAGLAGLRRNNRDQQMSDRDRNVTDIRRAA